MSADMNERIRIDLDQVQRAVHRWNADGAVHMADLLTEVNAAVLPDSRIARIEALDGGSWDGVEYAYMERVRAILRGDA